MHTLETALLAWVWAVAVLTAVLLLLMAGQRLARRQRRQPTTVVRGSRELRVRRR